MAELMELKAKIAVTEEDLGKAKREGKEELVLALQNTLTELLKEKNKLPEGARAGTSTRSLPPLSVACVAGERCAAALAGAIRVPHRFPLLCRH